MLAHQLGYLAGSALTALLVSPVSGNTETPALGGVAMAQEVDAVSKRSFTVVARKYDFVPERLEVDQDDLVKIVLRSDDIAHSFTIDSYRIARRVVSGGSTVFEFRADRPGTFVFYCNLSSDDGCRRMRGELVVRPKR